MNIEPISFVGFAAGFISMFCFLPQVIKTWKSKRTKDISLAMYAILCSGVFLWLVYGLLIRDLPVISTNIFVLMLTSAMLFFKLKYK